MSQTIQPDDEHVERPGRLHRSVRPWISVTSIVGTIIVAALTAYAQLLLAQKVDRIDFNEFKSATNERTKLDSAHFDNKLDRLIEMTARLDTTTKEIKATITRGQK